jgi:hypothetical protein
MSSTIACNAQIILATLPLRCTICVMANDDLVSKVMAEMGRRGGQARAKALTAKQRKESALKASRAAAKARTRKAKERKAQNG